MRSDHGNALFLILTAVALFAALSYAVTNSGRGGSGIDAEQREIQISQLLQYSAMLESTIQRLRIINGCSEAELNFDNPDETGYTNGDYDSECSIYHPSGGGLSWINFEQTFNGGANFGVPIVLAANEVDGVGTTCAADSCVDLILVVNFADENSNSLPMCNAINKRLGIDVSPPPVDTNITAGTKFTGSFTYNADLKVAGDVLLGKRSGCFQETTGGDNDYQFYHVLLAR